MTEFYPGSNKKKKQYEESLSVQVPLEEDLDLGKGKKFVLQGEVVELYPLGALAKALNRQPVTIRKLEQEGILPKATLILPSHDSRGQRRLYTRRQIEQLRKIAEEEGVLEPNKNGKWKSIDSTDFKAKALKVFKER